jgi:hypothetical protein
MKGLQLAQEYCNSLGAPMLRQQFGELVDRIAVGLSGPGSECFGFDDDISRDYDSGPAFCMWLTTEDYGNHGTALQRAYEELPQVFKGFGPRVASPGEELRTGVCPTVTFYATYTGLNHAPVTLKDWLYIPEQSLAFYPGDIRLKKIASRCMTIAQSGQYNLPRSLKRAELFAAHASVTQFCTDMMSLVFLLNKRYAPFYKWMHRAVREFPLLGEWTHSLVSNLIAPTDLKEKPTIIEAICAVIIRELRSEGLTESSSDFLLEHAHRVHSRIRDADLRQQFTVMN